MTSAFSRSINVKIALIGDSTVGKTSIVNVCQGGDFNSDQEATIGACFHIKNVVVKDIMVRMHIWDTAGQERYKSLTPMYYKDSNFIIIVYAINNISSFNEVEMWAETARKECSIDPVIVLVGNKTDLESERTVSQENGEKMAERIEASMFFEVSAKTKADEVLRIFEEIASQSVTDEKVMQVCQGETVMIPKKKKSCC